ncbi:sugar porter family MFS transporter [Parafrigoribacterium soli]|uniref:sugar porter family MFS transporter n=1 Tax=Parafrigoribacterium soli TaxID=3144663 RepID=UPI0032EA9CB8
MSNFISGMRASGNGMLLRISIIAAIGGLLFGFDTGVISGALLYLKKDLHANDVAQEWIVSVLLLGAIVGAIASGYLADRMSRKWTKVMSGCIYVIGALGCAFAVSIPMLIFFRFLLGLSVGTASFVAPLYISEVSPPRVRGGLVSFNQLAITSGILLAYLVNFAFSSVPDGWRWMLGVGAIPGAALAVGMLMVPHTPRWLLEHGREDEARTVLQKLRGSDPDADIEQEIEEVRDAQRKESSTTVRDLLKPNIRPLIWVGAGLAIFQQFVGINTVIYYAPTILSKTGLTNSASITQTVFVGVTNVVFTIIAVLLLDRIGRRRLLLIGTVGLTVAIIFLGVFFASPWLQQNASYLALVALIVYIASFAVGLGPVFWLMIAEIYPMGIRSKAMSLATVLNWAANFLVAGTFLTLISLVTRQGAFFIFGFLGILAIAFFAWKVPETRDKSLEQLQDDLLGGKQHD